MKKIVLSIIVGFALLGCGGSSGGGNTDDKSKPIGVDKNVPDIYGKAKIIIMNNRPRGMLGEDSYDRVYYDKVLVDHQVFCTDYQYSENDLISHVENYDGRTIEKEYEKSNGYFCGELTYTKKHLLYEANSTIIYYSKD